MWFNHYPTLVERGVTPRCGAPRKAYIPVMAQAPESPPAAPQWPTLSSFRTGLRCRCPRCGEGALFQGFLSLRPSCSHCGLDYSFADPADGPAFFVMSGVGIAVTTLFLWMEVALRPPMWVHFVFTLPLFVVGCLATLRPVKGWLVSQQYVNKAVEACFTPRSGSTPEQAE